jgi:protein-tyrosine-phosphatase
VLPAGVLRLREGVDGEGVRYLDWDLADPKGQPVEAVRVTRDEIARRVEALVAELDRG